MKDQELIYDLIFSEKKEFVINIEEYVEVHNHEHFIDEIKEVLEKSKVKIISSSLIVNSKSVIWTLKINK